MAARTQTELSEEAKGIQKKLGIQTQAGTNAGQSGGQLPSTTVTMEQSQLRMMALILEVLINIRQGEKNP